MNLRFATASLAFLLLVGSGIAQVGAPAPFDPAIDPEQVPVATACTYRVAQSDKMVDVRPLHKPGLDAAAYYDYYNADAHTGLERADSSTLFLYRDDAGLVSLFVLHDVPDSGSGGAADLDITALPLTTNTSPLGIQWVVMDDPGDLASTTDPNPTWTWNDDHTDGGAFQVGPAGTGLSSGYVMLVLDPAWNDWATEAPLTPGTVQDWNFLSLDAPTGRPPAHPDQRAGLIKHHSLNMIEPLVLFSNCPERTIEPGPGGRDPCDSENGPQAECDGYEPCSGVLSSAGVCCENVGADRVNATDLVSLTSEPSALDSNACAYTVRPELTGTPGQG